jgi:hypothetical protein
MRHLLRSSHYLAFADVFPFLSLSLSLNQGAIEQPARKKQKKGDTNNAASPLTVLNVVNLSGSTAQSMSLTPEGVRLAFGNQDRPTFVQVC